MSGKDEGFTLETTGSRLRFDIDDETTWVYLYYTDWEYTDVRIDTIAENLGMNTNSVSLFCRYSDDGWYEFNIANNGEFWIYYFDNSINDYRLLWSGGSNAINMGKDINEYTAFCVGNQLSLYINGVEAKTVTHKNLKSGLVGLSMRPSMSPRLRSSLIISR